MTNVTELVGDSYLPAGVSREVALRIAGEMRQIMARDLEEVDIALEVTLYESQMDKEQMLGAWGYLGAPERRAWKSFLDYETYLKNEIRRRSAVE
jgi:hypothetical protein